MFFHPLTKSPGGLLNIGRLACVCLAFPVVDNILLLVDGILPLGCISIDLRVLTPLKHTCIVVYLNIFLKDSIRRGKYGTEIKNCFFTSCPVSGCIRGPHFSNLPHLSINYWG